uniref:Uncharacterized protein n=1 Tax=Arundo donax TaxID=35708 RepID=A0A0A9DVX6_ARUDO
MPYTESGHACLLTFSPCSFG